MKKLFLPALFILSIAVIYILITIFITNHELLVNTLVGKYSADYKFKIFSGIISGMFYSYSQLQIILTILIAFLSGLNIYLLKQKITKFRSDNKLHFVVGTGILLGITAGNCAFCAVPLLAILGIGGSFSLLPFNGYEFLFLSLILQAISLIFLTRGGFNADYCRIKPVKKTKKSKN